MMFLPSRVEAAVGTTLSLPLQVRGTITLGNGEQLLEPFSDCRRMSLSIVSSETSVFNVTMDTEAGTVQIRASCPPEAAQMKDASFGVLCCSYLYSILHVYAQHRTHAFTLISIFPPDPASLPRNACLSLTALAVLPGHTKLTVQYTHSDIQLETSVIIASYLPLSPIHPPDIAVLTLGASYDFLFEGGPAPWVLDKSKYYQRLSAHVPSQLSLYRWSDGSVGVGQHVWRVTCRDLGEQELELEVGNGPTLKNPHPASEVARATVSCALPVSMTIYPVVDLTNECPLLQSSNQNARFPVKAGHTLELEVKIFDAENRAFSNFSSLEWKWGSSDPILLRPPAQGAGRVHHKTRGDLLLVQLSQQSGSVVMTASSESYQPHYLTAENIKKQVSPVS